MKVCVSIKLIDSDLKGTTIDRLSSCARSRGISPLNNKILHHSVKFCAIIVTWSEEKYYSVR